MTSEFISIDGKVTGLKNCGTQLSELLTTNYTYRYLHVNVGKPQHLSTQLKLLDHSCESLFGQKTELGAKELSSRVAELLYRCNAPSGSNLVKIVLSPVDADDRPRLFLFYESPMVYSGYCLWHRPYKALPLIYETPFPAYKTAAGYYAHQFSQLTARRQECDIAISVNYAAEAVSAGDHPLFCVHGKEVYTADALTSVAQTTERLLGIELCSLAGLTVHENALRQDVLSEMDEIFAIVPQGIIPIGRAAGKLYPTSIVKMLEGLLPRIRDVEFAL